MNDIHPQEPALTHHEIRDAVRARLDRYVGLNVLEKFAMFMGIAQIWNFASRGSFIGGTKLTSTAWSAGL